MSIVLGLMLLVPSWAVGLVGLGLCRDSVSARSLVARAVSLGVGLALVACAVGCSAWLARVWLNFEMPVSGT